MNQFQYLSILLKILHSFEIRELHDLGTLANEIDSIRCSLLDPSREFNTAAQQLWEALEVIGVSHQESGLQLTNVEKQDLNRFVAALIQETIKDMQKMSCTTD